MSRPNRAVSETGDPLLLTPGPLTTGKRVKEVMVHDWGSRDAAFIEINSRSADAAARGHERRRRLRHRADAGLGHVRGRGHADDLRSGRRQGAAADQRRLWPAREENSRHREAQGRGARDARGYAAGSRRHRASAESDAAITHVFAVHCETTSGILNPIVAIGALAQKYGKSYLIDSMSAFGALPLDAQAHQARRGRGLVEQMHRGRAGPRLRDRRRAALEKTAGQRHHAGARPARPVEQFREDRPVPLHAADPRDRVVPSGADGILRGGRAAPAAAGATARTAAC